MKKTNRHTATQAILLLFAFCTTNLSAQHTIQSAWSYTGGTDKPGSTLSLSWYQADAAFIGNVIRLSYTNTKEGFYYANPMQIFQLDISKRWNSTTEKKVNAFFEAGISGMMTSTKVIDSYYEITTVICDCEVEPLFFAPTQVEVQQDHNGVNFLYEVEDKNYLVEYLPGANVSLGLDVSLSESFYLGIHTGGHLYFHPGLKKTFIYSQIGVHSGIRF